MDKNTEISLKWDEEQQQGWRSTFIETIKKNFHISENNDLIDNDVFVEFGESEEEKALIREQCEEIDSFYENRKALVKAKKENSELKDGDWLLREMEEEVNEICQASEGRNMTPDEIKVFRQTVKDQFDKNIITEAEGFR